MFRLTLPALLLAGALAPAPVLARETPVTQPAAAPVLSLERVFASPGIAGAVPRGVKLSPDGRFLTVLRNRADDRDRYDLWGFDRQS
ncbi:hypothetical protein ACE4Z6_27150, partial [Salmonella enterica]|uniref:hypothetical protein n=1 Tax=Salmonella enterica TaxID=28901 RepID=UPI003D278FCF